MRWQKSLIILYIFLHLTSVVATTEKHFIVIRDNDQIFLNIDLQRSKIYWIDSESEFKSTGINLVPIDNLSNYLVAFPFPQSMQNNPQEYYYQGKISIPLYVKAIDDSKQLSFKIKLHYLLCEEQCTAVNQELTVEAKDNYYLAPKFNKLHLTKLKYYPNTIELIVSFDEYLKKEVNFAIDQRHKNFIKDVNYKKINNNSYELKIVFDEHIINQLDNRSFQLYSSANELPLLVTIPQNYSKTESHWLFIITFAFLGGVIMNFMPCVLPILSIKLLNISKLSNNKLTIWMSIAGIQLSFIVLGLIAIICKMVGMNFSLGMNFQNSQFVIFLMIVLVIMISATLGRINLPLPQLGWLLHLNKFSHYIKVFFLGVLSVVLSSACTGPLLGTALSFSLATDSYIVIISTFIMIGLGFSLPYGLLLVFPNITDYIPKSGRWNNYLKNFIGVMLVLTLIWLGNVIYDQLDIKAVSVLFMLLLLIKFIVENNESFLGKIYWKLILLKLLVFFALYLPINAYQQDNEHQKNMESIWQKFEADKIPFYLSQGKVVLVDITSTWCATCKFNKMILWDRQYTVNMLKNLPIVAMRGDYSTFDPDIYKYLKYNNVHGIPFSKVYSNKFPQGLELPVVIFFDDLKQALVDALSEK